MATMHETHLSWQESTGESNFSPVKMIPQVRVNPSIACTSSPDNTIRFENTRPMPSPEQFNSMSVHERLFLCNRQSPTSLPTLMHDMSPGGSGVNALNFIDGVHKFPDHRHHVNVSPIKVRPSTGLSAVCNEPRMNSSVPQLQCAHESIIALNPSRSHVTAYKGGLQVHSPLKIVVHQKRGVKLPKISPDKPSNSVARNHHGGFYSTTA